MRITSYIIMTQKCDTQNVVFYCSIWYNFQGNDIVYIVKNMGGEKWKQKVQC